MRFLNALLACLFWATTLFADCSYPTTFDSYPKDRKAALYARTAKTSYPEGLLWQVEKNGHVSYILGTMHIADARHAPILDAVAPLLDQVDAVFLELSKEAESDFLRYLTANPDLYLIQQGPSLMERLGPETWAALQPQLKEAGLPEFMAARFQPWFLGLSLAIPPCVTAQQKAGKLGLDRQLEARALPRDLPIRSLDVPADLVSLMGGTPLDEQVRDFRDSLAYGALSHDIFGDITEFYFNEETAMIWEFSKQVVHDQAGPAHKDRIDALFAEMGKGLVTERNRLWIDTLAPALSDAPAVVAVGAMHLPGQDGVLSLLAEQGFAVSRVPLTH
ncbi:TraB/GumN family protein [Shimia sp. SDUM112013]|uniref:TraB/GumN family protein n=1 Tax=Shimia sp. SDUM112013 TaxID=3136160 RepID=UPI0032EFE1A3